MASLSTLYLKSLGYIFAVAFISYYVQFPALSSRSGIEPSERIFRQSFPTLHSNVVEAGYADADSFVELLTILGVVLSTLIASGLIHHGIVFFAITAIYHFLAALGASMYSFQWDILLVETGFLSALCFAPWQSLTLKSEQRVGSWPIRFLLFKLMYMSGVVKIQANCPTWQNLTALEYHFATQCLPGPLAWYAHQMHPLLLRLGVAATFVIEIPAAFLLIAPFVSMRKVGAWLQILLQVLIILTGSYNFFNLLTIALCLPCMVGDESLVSREKTRCSRLGHALQLLACVLFLSWSCKEMFIVYYVEDPADPLHKMIGLKLATTSHDCNYLLEWAVPAAFACTLVFVAVTGVDIMAKTKGNRFNVSVHTLVCFLCIVATAVPFLAFSPNPYHPTIWGHQWSLNQATWAKIRRHSSRVSHSYGLFRRMTGVGQQEQRSIDTPAGWAGLPPSIVARPEIILEAKVDDSEWRELGFRWKPGRVDQRPLQAAPHQPRMDWRMWFAALGQIQNNPWLASFVHKLLSGCPAVLDLLDEPELAAGNHKLTSIRANLYQYDFTRWDTKWARRIPGVDIVDTTNATNWWTRKLVRQYLPPLEVNNESLLQFLDQAGYGMPVCEDIHDRCKTGGPTALVCRVAVYLRRWKPWTLPLVAFLFCCAIEYLCHSQYSRPEKPKID